MIQINFYSFHGTLIKISYTRYPEGNTLAVLAHVKYDDGVIEQIKISTNLFEHAHLLKKDEFFFKFWSENEPISKALVKNKIIDIVNENAVVSGFVAIPIVKLSEKGRELLEVE